MIRVLTVLFVATPIFVQAQEALARGESLELTAEIVDIDHDIRLITLEDEKGEVKEIFVGLKVKQFDELKVGDRLTFRYYESIVSQVGKPGESAPAPSSEPTLVRGSGPKPSGTLSQQFRATVTIRKVDVSVPSVTVETEDGRTMSFRVADKNHLEGVQPGERVDITYTTAMIIAVK